MACCKSAWITTRRYTADGTQSWVADFGSNTTAGCVDADDNAFVGGGRATDLSVTVLQAGGGTLNSIQQISPGKQTGGTWRITLNGFRSQPVAWNLSASDAQSAAQAMGNVGSGNVNVSGGPFPQFPLIFEFVGALAGKNVGTLSFESYMLTGFGTVRKYRASDGKLLAQADTQTPVTSMLYANGSVYAATSRSAGIRLVGNSVQAYGEVNGGKWKPGFLSLSWGTDCNWNCTAFDVQGSINSVPNLAGLITASGGPLPDNPIVLTQGTLPLYTSPPITQIQIQDGNITGGCNLYRFPLDLDTAPEADDDGDPNVAPFSIDTGMQSGIIAADSGGNVYFSGGDSFGTVQTNLIPGGEDRTDWNLQMQDIWIRQYDSDGNEQTLGLNNAVTSSPLVIASNGNIYCNTNAQGLVYKFYDTGAPTSGGINLNWVGEFPGSSGFVWFDAPVSRDPQFGDPPFSHYGILLEIYGLGTGHVASAGAVGTYPLNHSPIWVTPEGGTSPFTLGGSTVVGGTIHMDPLPSTRTQSGVSYYTSGGALVDSMQNNGVNTHPGVNVLSGRAMAMDRSGNLLLSPWDEPNQSVLTLITSDFSALVWRAEVFVNNPTLLFNIPQTYCCGFDSAGNVYQAGTQGDTHMTTRKFNANANPPTLLWQRNHGLTPTATGNGQDTSVLALQATSDDGLMTTGVRVKKSQYP